MTTSIEWTHMPGFKGDVWNPTTGCTRVSAGCDNCYAFELHDKRFAMNLKAAKDAGAHRMTVIAQLTNPETIILRARTLGVKLPWPKQYDRPFSRVQLLEDRVEAPLHRRTPTCYFVDSMADLFHEDVPDEFLDRVFHTMELVASTRHRFLILTKRPERMRAYLTERWGARGGPYMRGQRVYEPEHIWLGTSVEDQRAADERIPHLLATPAAVRFLSCEPLIGPIDLRRWLGFPVLIGTPTPTEEDLERIRREWDRARAIVLPAGQQLVIERRGELHWVIVGGESGARAREMDLRWARSLRDDCAAAGVSFFMKQLGSKPGITDYVAVDEEDVAPEWDDLELRESHGRDMSEWPEDLRIRTWPQ